MTNSYVNIILKKIEMLTNCDQEYSVSMEIFNNNSQSLRNAK